MERGGRIRRRGRSILCSARLAGRPRSFRLQGVGRLQLSHARFLAMILPDLPFESDECSGPLNWFWKLLYRKNQPPWCQCCVEHDFAYWQGGTAVQRATADADLMA